MRLSAPSPPSQKLPADLKERQINHRIVHLERDASAEQARANVYGKKKNIQRGRRVELVTQNHGDLEHPSREKRTSPVMPI